MLVVMSLPSGGSVGVWAAIRLAFFLICCMAGWKVANCKVGNPFQQQFCNSESGDLEILCGRIPKEQGILGCEEFELHSSQYFCGLAEIHVYF